MKILAYIRSTLAEPFQGKQLYEKGASVVISNKVVTKTLGTFMLIPPDPVSLSLNDAQNFIDRTLKLKERIVKTKEVTIFPKKYKTEELEALNLKNVYEVLKIDPEAEVIRQVNPEKIYSFIQSGANTMISLMTAVESFANVMIPKDHKEKVFKKGAEVELDKNGIVRWCSTVEKLEILGRIHNKADFKSKSHWQSFLDIKKLRDDFIHFKQAHAHIDSIWNPMVVGLVDSDLQKFYNDTVTLIKYFRSEYFD